MKQKAYLLIVDDEEDLRETMTESLVHAKYHVNSVGNATRGKQAMQEGMYDLLILDVRLPDGDGLELLQEFRKDFPNTGIILITGYADVDIAVEAIRLGADDFLKKPFTPDELLIRIEEVLKKRTLEKEHEELSRKEQARHANALLIGKSSGIRQINDTIALLGDSDSTVLITGESGTGKEVVAKALHASGSRSKKPLISVNCGAIPEELLESELFGHIKGAFTGATQSRAGRFQAANQGTIFLDEIGDMSAKLQVKLLRVLQERCIEPVGSNQSVEIDVRVITATHQNLEKLIDEGKFREDLYYRLNVIPLHLPPLRDRDDDILLLADHFISLFNKMKGAELTGITGDAASLMLKHAWPGNVRELQNLVERVATLKREGKIEQQDLSAKMQTSDVPTIDAFKINIKDKDSLDLKHMVNEFENHLIVSALQQFDWNKNRAANFLSMNRTTLIEKIKKKGLQPAETS